ncbi:MAG: helix-turn-helix transcriptional regulator [Bacteriovoracaceae bacterium]|nr:helix-turn-helix transcriptional regulator [Bacteriovoracaceae bacterium]
MEFEEYLKEVGKNIKSIRQRLNLRQKEISKWGYSLRHYQDIESGSSNLTLKTLWNLALAFEVEVQEITEYKRSTGSKNSSSLSDSLFEQMPFGAAFWELEKLNNPRSFVLIRVNQKAVQINPIFNQHSIGKKLVDIFPYITDEQLKSYYSVIKTNKLAQLSDVVYMDENIPFSIYSNYIVRCSDRVVGLIFEDITQMKLKEEKDKKQKALASLGVYSKLGEHASLQLLRQEVDDLLMRLGQPPKYR